MGWHNFGLDKIITAEYGNTAGVRKGSSRLFGDGSYRLGMGDLESPKGGERVAIGPYTVVATYPSKSNPGKTHTVNIDENGELSCTCPGWCKRVPKTGRTCIHVRSEEQKRQARQLGPNVHSVTRAGLPTRVPVPPEEGGSLAEQDEGGSLADLLAEQDEGGSLTDLFAKLEKESDLGKEGK